MRILIGFLFALVLVYLGVITPEGLHEAGEKVQKIAGQSLSH